MPTSRCRSMRPRSCIRARHRSCHRSWSSRPTRSPSRGPGPRGSCRPCGRPASRSNRASTASSRSRPMAPRSWANRRTSRASGWPRRCGSPTRCGVGKAMAEWLVDGGSPTDLHEGDVNRFEAHQLAPVVHPRPRCPELRRGLRHHPSAPADGGPTAAPDVAVLRARAGAGRRTSSRATAGSGRTGTGRTRGSWGGTTSRAATPGPSATGTPSPAPRRAPPATRPACTT